jgi:hypothetical protein
MADADDFARQARVEDAAEARARRAEWARRRAEEATLAEVLARAGTVRLRTPWGPVVGTVDEVGLDYCAVGGRHLALDLVEVVEPDGSAQAPVVDRTLTEVLARAAGTGEPVAVRTRGGEIVRGRVDAVGLDVVTIRRDEPPGAVYVSSSSLAEVLAGEGSG